MDRTVREKALEMAGRLECVEAGDDPLLPGVIRGLRRVIDRYLDGNPPEIAADDGIHPARARMRELLAVRGPDGYRAGELWTLLRAEGYVLARETVQRWLTADEREGLVRRPARSHRPVSRWVLAGPAAPDLEE